ncbi:MAG TPA: hypothetical protein VNL35_16745 [Chloroflexota bacterium]|nr:hypothetical protein [Chloroflexota bacterium]
MIDPTAIPAGKWGESVAGVDYTRILERVKLSVQRARLMSDEDLEAADHAHEVGTYHAPTQPGVIGLRTGPGVFFPEVPGVPTLAAIIDDIWLADRDLSKTLTSETVTQYYVFLVRTILEGSETLNLSTIKKLFADMWQLKIVAWGVFRALHGATIAVDEPLELGPFTIYNWEAHGDRIELRYPPHYPGLHKRHRPGEGDLWICTEVVARDSDRAVEIADERFEQFEAVIAFMLGWDARWQEIGILNYQPTTRLDVIVLTEEHYGGHRGTERRGTGIPVDVDAPWFRNTDVGHDLLWKYLLEDYGTKGAVDLHSRVLRTVIWAGKASRDRDCGRKLVQFLFALEALFSQQDHTQTLSERLAECVALCLGDTSESRRSYAKRTKDLYEKRSALAHGRTQSIVPQDRRDAHTFVRDCARAFLTRPELSVLKSIKDFNEWIFAEKYR